MHKTYKRKKWWTINDLEKMIREYDKVFKEKNEQLKKRSNRKLGYRVKKRVEKPKTDKKDY